MPTKTVTCTDIEWTDCQLIGSKGALLQISGQGNVRVFMGLDAPTQSDITGIVFGQGDFNELPIMNIPDGEELWIRGIDGTRKIVVMYG